ncbi:hypothetical protein Srubr_36760 [Streptomyces rubradiris]|uniref:Uncharacterized protein n=1 Tax=Streptomyces rubradiris TaxID=285531 RepID=A0ABQ3RD93_STRRR|nr:hypothetical protein GCM10018792_05680 [Streptomyces rubradiris]GHI53830.1 hypothetical protein Srubr_36760 [Streptomyces rubradiris]
MARASNERHGRQPVLSTRLSCHNQFPTDSASLTPDIGALIMSRTPSLADDYQRTPVSSCRTPMNISGEEAEDLALYQEKCRRRLLESPEELHGSTKGSWSCRCTPQTGRSHRAHPA